MADEERKVVEYGICHGGTRCPRNGIVPKYDLHETGFCGACCPRFGPLTCPQCDWSELLEGEDDDFW